MNPPAIFSCPVANTPRSEARQGQDRQRYLAYVVIAIIALITGLLLGQLGGEDQRGSRIAWPTAGLLHPRQHPRTAVAEV